MIYTSYFAKMKSLPENAIPISISLSKPKGIVCQDCKSLAPDYKTLKAYKETGDTEAYVEEYVPTKLINVERVLTDILSSLSDIDKDRVVSGTDYWWLNKNVHVVLMCWESSGKFCHRNLVAEFLEDNGIPCREFTQ